MMKRPRTADGLKLRRNVKKPRGISENVCNGGLVYAKLLTAWALLVAADYLLGFRFEYLWPFWLLMRTILDSFRYQGLAFSVFFMCVTVTSDLVCFVFIPMQWLFFLASTYVWVQYVWHADRGVCVPTVSLWLLFIYVEASVRFKDLMLVASVTGGTGSRSAAAYPFTMDLCRPFAAHCIGYPVVTLGFGIKSYLGGWRLQRRQREVGRENEAYSKLLTESLPATWYGPGTRSPNTDADSTAAIEYYDERERISSSSPATSLLPSMVDGGGGKAGGGAGWLLSSSSSTSNGFGGAGASYERESRRTPWLNTLKDRLLSPWLGGWSSSASTQQQQQQQQAGMGTPSSRSSGRGSDVEDLLDDQDSSMDGGQNTGGGTTHGGTTHSGGGGGGKQHRSKRSGDSAGTGTNKRSPRGGAQPAASTNSAGGLRQRSTHKTKDNNNTTTNITSPSSTNSTTTTPFNNNNNQSSSSTTTTTTSVGNALHYSNASNNNSTARQNGAAAGAYSALGDPGADEDSMQTTTTTEAEERCNNNNEPSRKSYGEYAAFVDNETMERLRSELRSSRAAESELRSQVHNMVSADKSIKSEVQQLRSRNEQLENKLNNLVRAREQDKMSIQTLEKKLVEAQSRRSELEKELSNERKSKQKDEAAAARALANATKECGDACKQRRRELESDLKQLRRDLRMKDDQMQQLDNELMALRQYKDAHNAEVLMTALSTMREKNTHLEQSLSAENRLKQDLFRALGDAKCQIDNIQGQLRNRDSEVQELRRRLTTDGTADGGGLNTLTPPPPAPSSQPPNNEENSIELLTNALANAAAAAYMQNPYGAPNSGYLSSSSVSSVVPTPDPFGSSSVQQQQQQTGNVNATPDFASATGIGRLSTYTPPHSN